MLSKLLTAAPEQSDEELRDHLITLLLAGHETTASTLAWTLHDLARKPELLARVQRAADEGDEDYLEAVVKEAMRLRPVIRNVARRLAKPVTVAGYDLPAGVVVFPSIHLVQHSEDVWDDAAEFRPERFLGAQPAARDVDPVRRRPAPLPGREPGDHRGGGGAQDRAAAGRRVAGRAGRARPHPQHHDRAGARGADRQPSPLTGAVAAGTVTGSASPAGSRDVSVAASAVLSSGVSSTAGAGRSRTAHAAASVATATSPSATAVTASEAWVPKPSGTSMQAPALRPAAHTRCTGDAAGSRHSTPHSTYQGSSTGASRPSASSA